MVLNISISKLYGPKDTEISQQPVFGFYQRPPEGLLHGHCVHPFTTGNH